MPQWRRALPWLISFMLLVLLLHTWTHPEEHPPGKPVWKAATWFDTTSGRRER